MKNFVYKYATGACELFGAGFMCLFMLGTCLNVVLRYCFGFIITGVEEAIVYSFLWMSYIGIAACFINNKLTSIDVIYNILPRAAKRIMDVIIQLICLATTVFITYCSHLMIEHVGTKTTYVLRISYRYIDGAIWVCFIIMAIAGVFLTIESVKKVFKRDSEELSQKDIPEE